MALLDKLFESFSSPSFKTKLHSRLDITDGGSSSSSSSSSNGGGGGGTNLHISSQMTVLENYPLFESRSAAANSIPGDLDPKSDLDLDPFSLLKTSAPFLAASSENLVAVDPDMPSSSLLLGNNSTGSGLLGEDSLLSHASDVRGDVHLESYYYDSSEWSAEQICGVLAVAVIVPFILVSNLLVIVSVTRFKRLQIPTNYFIVSLAAVDIFVALVTPFVIVIEILPGQMRDVLLCLSPNRILMTACGVSVLTLAAIAYDRHTALVSPLKYVSVMTIRRIVLLVILIWVYSAAIVWAPLPLGWYHSPSASGVDSASLASSVSSSASSAFSSTSSSFDPPSSDSSFFPSDSTPSSSKDPPGGGSFGVSSSPSPSTSPPSSSSPPSTAPPAMPCSFQLLHDSAHVLFLGAIFGPACLAITVCYFRIYTVARHHARAIAAVENSVHHNVRVRFMIRDAKYAKTLALVIGVFLLLWTPYLGCLLAEVVLTSVHVSPWLWNYLTLLAVLNSGLNPWIYAFKNNEFRTAFRRIFRACCWWCCGSPQADGSSSSSSASNCCLPFHKRWSRRQSCMSDVNTTTTTTTNTLSTTAAQTIGTAFLGYGRASRRSGGSISLAGRLSDASCVLHVPVEEEMEEVVVVAATSAAAVDGSTDNADDASSQVGDGGVDEDGNGDGEGSGGSSCVVDNVPKDSHAAPEPRPMFNSTSATPNPSPSPRRSIFNSTSATPNPSPSPRRSIFNSTSATPNPSPSPRRSIFNSTSATHDSTETKRLVSPNLPPPDPKAITTDLLSLYLRHSMSMKSTETTSDQSHCGDSVCSAGGKALDDENNHDLCSNYRGNNLDINPHGDLVSCVDPSRCGGDLNGNCQRCDVDFCRNSVVGSQNDLAVDGYHDDDLNGNLHCARDCCQGSAGRSNRHINLGFDGDTLAGDGHGDFVYCSDNTDQSDHTDYHSDDQKDHVYYSDNTDHSAGYHSDDHQECSNVDCKNANSERPARRYHGYRGSNNPCSRINYEGNISASAKKLLRSGYICKHDDGNHRLNGDYVCLRDLKGHSGCNGDGCHGDDERSDHSDHVYSSDTADPSCYHSDGYGSSHPEDHFYHSDHSDDHIGHSLDTVSVGHHTNLTV